VKIHEYQAKTILRRYGVAVPEGKVASTVDEAVAAARELGGNICVVKSQIHAGGRGKGRFFGEVPDAEVALAAAGHPAPGPGGVRLAKSLDDVARHAASMLGRTLVTKQTGPEGKVVGHVYIEAGCDIARELYLGVLLDRATSKLVVMASTEGGTEIEEVAHHTPEKILKVWVDPLVGLGAWQARQIAFGLGLSGKAVNKAVAFMQALYRCYLETDASMVEINPLVVTGSGDIIALDCKMAFDDNAMYRHADLESLRDLAEEDPSEVAAGKFALSYVKLDGEIGCMVNGAGLAMATMDIIKFKGGQPANFLDVGGGATQEAVAAAFRIITADPNVKCILVNIFGGIMKCDVIANGVIAAVHEVGLKVPLVVRLAGTNVDLGRKLLAESGLDIISAGDLNEAAEAAVAAVR
jgi:succinyl-CoA synthetase beta subunit